MLTLLGACFALSFLLCSVSRMPSDQFQRSIDGKSWRCYAVKRFKIDAQRSAGLLRSSGFNSRVIPVRKKGGETYFCVFAS